MITISKLATKILKETEKGDVNPYLFHKRYKVTAGYLSKVLRILLDRKLIRYERMKIKRYED